MAAATGITVLHLHQYPTWSVWADNDREPACFRADLRDFSTFEEADQAAKTIASILEEVLY